MLKTKLKLTIPREFPGFCRLQQASRYGVRLAEERRRWTILTLDCFRFATLKIVAIRCYVGLDMSICYLALILLCKQLYIDWSCHLIFGPSLNMGSLPRAFLFSIFYFLFSIFIEHMQPLKWDMQKYSVHNNCRTLIVVLKLQHW